MQINNGLYSPAALALILGAILTTLLALPARRSDDAPRRPGPSGRLLIVLLVGLAANLALLIQAPAGMYLRPAAAAHRFFPAALAAAALLVLLIAFDRSRTRRVWFPLLLVVAVGLGVWMIEGSPRPKIDVLTVHRYAIAALRDGDNPYGIRVEPHLLKRHRLNHLKQQQSNLFCSSPSIPSGQCLPSSRGCVLGAAIRRPSAQ